LIKQLQDKVGSTEQMVVDIALFQAQALEVLKKLEIAQKGLLSKVKIVQNHSQVMDEALSNIVLRERDVIVARTVSFNSYEIYSMYYYNDECSIYREHKVTIHERMRPFNNQ
jgi:hypothetical protein